MGQKDAQLSLYTVYEEKRRRNRAFLIILLALLMVAALVGATFAQVGLGVTISVTALAGAGITVADATNDPSWGPLNRGKVGGITPGDLYILTPDSGFSGFIVLTLALVNAGDLANDVYKYLILMIKICEDDPTDTTTATEPAVDSNGDCNATNGWRNPQATGTEPKDTSTGETRFMLSLKNANIEFIIDHTVTDKPPKYAVSISRGSFKVDRSLTAGTVDHEFFLVVETEE